MSTKLDTTSDHLLSMARDLHIVAAELDLDVIHRQDIGRAANALRAIAASRERPEKPQSGEKGA